MVDYGIARAKYLNAIVEAIKWEAPCLRSQGLSRRAHRARYMEEVSKRFAAK